MDNRDEYERFLQSRLTQLEFAFDEVEQWLRNAPAVIRNNLGGPGGFREPNWTRIREPPATRGIIHRGRGFGHSQPRQNMPGYQPAQAITPPDSNIRYHVAQTSLQGNVVGDREVIHIDPEAQNEAQKSEEEPQKSIEEDSKNKKAPSDHSQSLSGFVGSDGQSDVSTDNEVEITVEYSGAPGTYSTCSLCNSKQETITLSCGKHRLCIHKMCRLRAWYASTLKVISIDGDKFHAKIYVPSDLVAPAKLEECVLCECHPGRKLALAILAKFLAQVEPVEKGPRAPDGMLLRNREGLNDSSDGWTDLYITKGQRKRNRDPEDEEKTIMKKT